LRHLELSTHCTFSPDYHHLPWAEVAIVSPQSRPLPIEANRTSFLPHPTILAYLSSTLPSQSHMPGIPLDAMDKLKAIFKRKDKKESSTAGTKTNGTAAAVPKPTPTDTAAAPSTSDPTAPPAGAAPVDTGAPADPVPANTPAAK